MKMVIRTVWVYTTDKEESVFTFSDSLTFIYGNVGTGKSTLLDLVAFALGGKMNYTPAVRSCLRAVCVEILMNEHLYRFFRMARSEKIQVEDESIGYRMDIPCSEISDFIYGEYGLPVLYLSMGLGERKNVRLSLNNFLWFSYLKQEEMDNNFFNLDSENIYKKDAAVNVLYTFLESQYLIDTKKGDTYRNLKKRTRQYMDGREVMNYFSGIFNNEAVDEQVRSGITAEKLYDEMMHKIAEHGDTYSLEELMQYLSMQKQVDDLAYRNAFDVRKRRYEEECSRLLAQTQVAREEISLDQPMARVGVQKLHTYFLDCLVSIGFQGIGRNDTVFMDPKTHMPIIKNVYENSEVSFSNLGSGGKKTLFKVSYALALHRLQHSKYRDNYLPSFLIIDTPMKNISEREDEEMYNRFYRYLFTLFSNELADTQLIIVDKEKKNLEGYRFKDCAMTLRMTHDDRMNPPLFKNYEGL